jgi:gluconokinase
MVELAARTGAATAEGDALHPAANVAKMAAGIALTDDDREPWLKAIAGWIGEQEQLGRDAVVACSALRRKHRDLLRAGHPSVVFVQLVAPEAELRRRLETRVGHYMPPSLVPSQLETLEPLAPDEPGFILRTDRDPAALADVIVERFDLKRADGPDRE